MRVVRWESKGSRRSRWSIVAVPAAALLLLGAGYQIGRINAADWSTSDAAARAIVISPDAPDDQVRDALYVLSRHQRETADAVKRIAATTTPSAPHARNAIKFAQESWR